MTTITVSSLTELYAALATATGGETIALAPGNYGDMSLTMKSGFDLTFPSNVTITSADPDNPAVFTGLNIRDAANLTFDSVVFDYTFKAGDTINTRPFSISGGENIAITNSTFDGDVAQGVSVVDDGYGYAIGLSVNGVTGVTLAGNEIYNFSKGLVVSESSEIAVTGNDLHSMRVDGMNFAEVTDVLIEENYIHDFRGSPKSSDHCDMIQFWTKGTDAPSINIVIRGNVLDIGNGTATQSIFMRNDQVDQGLAGPEMFYQNVLIEQNVITNAHLHGITVGETAGLTIRNNSVLHADGGNQDGLDASVEIPRISVASTSTNVTVTSNVTSNISGLTTQTDWVVKQNAIVQDQNMLIPGYYGDVFVSSSLTSKDGVHQFLALPGGMIDLLGAGAAPTLEAPYTGNVTTLFNVTTDADGSVQTRTFDASLSHLDTGSLPAGTVYEWSFGDGTTAKGLTTTHTYADGGTYNVTLTVILPDGTRHPEATSVAVEDSLVLSLGADGTFRAQRLGAEIVLAPSPTATAGGIQLGATGVAASVAREHVTDILGTSGFDISLEIKADVAGTTGEIFRLHGSIIVQVNSKGELYVRAFGSEGEQVTLTTTGVVVNDLKEHDIGISLEDGMFSVTVDGQVAAQTAFTGTLASTGNHSLTFGNPWNGTNFNGDLSVFEITVGEIVQPDATLLPQAVVAQDGLVLSLGEDGTFRAQELGDEVVLPPSPTATADGIQLGATGVAASVAREHVTDILGTTGFDISLEIKADVAGTTGEIFRLHESIVVQVNSKGELYVRAFGSEGEQIKLTTTGVVVNDLKEHDIGISLEDGMFSVTVDGQVAAQTDFTGTLASTGNHSLTFGNPWNGTNFNGDLSSFEITVDAPVSVWSDGSLL